MKTCNSVILFLFAVTAAANTNLIDHEISINCGSTGSSSAAISGKQWFGDAYVTLKGSSLSTSSHSETISSLDPVPYKTARISRSQFSYSFQLNPGQKFIRLHFNPSSYYGFQSFNDLFNVEADPFTLLANFSASITARALAVNTFVKEFCISIQQNQSLDIIFTPATPSSHTSYAFINGIEIISLPSSFPYCLGGDIGVQVVGQKSHVVYIDNATALEMVRRLNVQHDSVLSPIDDMFGMWKTLLKEKAKKFKNNNITWKVSVDVGFRYLIRLHFCEVGLQMNFTLLINYMIANTNADLLQETEVNGVLWYRNHLVEVKGRKEEGKRDILISLHSKHESLVGHGNGPLEGFEIFKLSNHDNSLASPNPLPTKPDSPFDPIQNLLSLLGHRNAIATVVTASVCLVNIIVHMLRQHWESNSVEEENKPSTRARRLCRRFSLSQIESATENFNDAFVIGKGGFGKVYKGFIDNLEEMVAIKRLNPNSRQGKREFWTEIEMLSEVRHVNLVSLIGYCNEQREMILVYDYMSSGTLADHLYKLARKSNNCSSLSWKQRLEICIGAGRGLDYLHTGHGVIHRDVKASNILLDENFVAKVSDFGLAKTEDGDSTKLKGTFGYFDPDYFKTRKLTTKSDTYSFGVVLLEVLCGRPAVDPFAEDDKRSLTMWARENISKGDVDQIVAPSLRDEILPDSLMAFLGVAEKCLHDEPKKRPTIAHVIINLEFALEQQENALSLVPYEKTRIADFFPFANKTQQDNTKSIIPNEITSRADVLPFTDDRTILPGSTRQLTMVSSNVQNVTSSPKEQTNNETVNSESPYGKKEKRKTSHKLSRLWPWGAFLSSRKPSNKKNLAGVSFSISGGSNELIASPDLRIFSFSELKAATRNFRSDTLLGEGGFGKVYRGKLDTAGNKIGSVIAVKKLNSESLQGLKEWQSEVNFLGRLSHPNLVKLLGYCWEDKELLLVYEFMQKGSLDNHLFGRGSAIQPLSWDIRLKILIGASRGLAFLHASDRKVIYRDFKASNILLDGSYNAKLSDFGLAKMGPLAGDSHVTTQVMGTYGYAAPEYIATGHLYVKSDVYGFGVVLVEMLTGLRALDTKRPYGQHRLVDWIKPHLSGRRKLKMVMDQHLEGRYPITSALQVAKLARNCIEHEPKNRPSMQQVVETLEQMDTSVEKSSRQPKRVHFNTSQPPM
ncbi:hypothetical protein BUALT_Bualt12G0124600 [Buddleja alternifolia]|uniref:non-specific serine/threonine protein kinase n=1 Tax=Buddleja alternifolia TaxID=168488 RepID=A0AAV6WXZ7_9LAMI|nr:hypothetical protein BUALT_Bualt12G0124600 [Buddleja alternifolia]